MYDIQDGLFVYFILDGGIPPPIQAKNDKKIEKYKKSACRRLCKHLIYFLFIQIFSDNYNNFLTDRRLF